MSRYLIVGLASTIVIGALTVVPSSAEPMTPQAAAAVAPRPTNPLMSPSALPFGAPPFDKIQDRDYQPAIEAGMKIQMKEIVGIANNPAAPTFENTLVALERSGALLTRASAAFGAMASSNTNPTLQQIQQDIAPKLAAHQDAIFLNDTLFKRVEAVYNQRAALGLDPESAHLVEFYYQQFVRGGAKLSDADKVKLKALNAEDASLSAKYMTQLMGAAKDSALVVSHIEELAGLSKTDIESAAQAAKARGLEGKWLLPLLNTTQQPLFVSLTNRATREKLFRLSWNRAERGDANDTRAIIAKLASLRANKAGLLGFPNFAAWSLEDQMAKTPETVQQFLGRLIPASTANARAEANAIQAVIDQQKGGFTLEPWDWDFYAEQVRKATYDLDSDALAPYFELNRVLQDGVFYAAHELYGLDFKERHDVPVYQPDVRVFDVFDRDGSPLALFYCDYYARDNKNGGAWMGNYVNQSTLLGTKPVVYNIANFTKPAAGQPALLSLDDVTTIFHEFGHGLHGILANSLYPSLSGTSVARDFVELPSQFNEHWAFDPKVLAHYAIHYKTGAPMPQDLTDKIKKSATFNQGYSLTEILGAASLDMSWHSLPVGTPEQSPDTFEAAALEKAGLNLPQVPPRYRSSYFLHIWANGYSAGYYAYLWAEMLDNDAYAWFKEHGGLTRANGDRFRDMILSRGNAGDYAKMYREFRGSDPRIEPMLEKRGIAVK